MRAPLRQNNAKQRVSKGASIPAPINGWDAADPLAAMDPRNAVILDNFIPRQGFVELRKGWEYYAATDAAIDGSAVESLMAYHAVTSTNDKLFACASGKIYDVTSGGAGVDQGLTLSNSRIQHVNVSTTGGQYLYCVNGANTPKYWDGSTWNTPTFTGSGYTASDFINVNVYKSRVYFVQKGKLGFHYLDLDSIQGAVHYYDLGGLFSQGGYLMAMATWTIDGGTGVNDHAVFITSRGQIAVFNGSNPSDATDWALEGVYDKPEPLGRRCFCKAGGDLYIISIEGVFPLSRSLILDNAALTNVAITSNISRAMNESAQMYKDHFGWQIIAYPKSTLALLNVPVAENQTQYQYVMNTLSGAWARFTGQNANCWELFRDRLFFGGNSGAVCEADVSASDGGSDIVADGKTAFNYLSSRGYLKQFKMVQPLVTSDGRVAPLVTLNTDFKDALPTAAASVANPTDIYWDKFNWDESNWPEDQQLYSSWISASGIGQCVAIRFRVRANIANSSSLWDVGRWDEAVWDASQGSPLSLQVNGFNVIYETGAFF